MKYSLTIMLLLATSAHAKTWQVGPMRQYTVPSAVMNFVADGDTVLIDSGLYIGDVGVWTNSNLVLRCPNGMARFNANGNIAQEKGIWVLAGNNTYVEGFEFYGAAIDSADGDNGAGIRVGGNGLTCRRCYFHDNQEGILTANDTTNNNIWIEACEFDHNGVETGGLAGFEHNIYVGHSTSCTIKFCYFHASVVGHEIKTRANVNYILYNDIVDGPIGDGSYSIDIPNGGLSFVIGNSIEKGPMTANPTAITYGEEGIVNPDSEFYFVNNTVVTDRNPTTFLFIQPGTSPALIANNIFAGTGYPLTARDTMANVESTDTSFFHFADPTNYNYNLTENFPGDQNAANLGSVDGFLLTPVSEYVDAEDSEMRPFMNEIGAFAKLVGSTDSFAVIKNFPTITCSGEIDTEVLTIINDSSDSNSFQGSIAGANAADFKIISSNPSKLEPPGGVDTIIVIFTPASNADEEANLIITGGSDPIVFPLDATGGTAIISGRDTISTAVGQTSAPFAITICNTGTCPWNPGVPITVDPQFAFATLTNGELPTIAPGDCAQLYFTFSPTESGTFTYPVTFPNATGTSIPPPNVTITVNVNGAGVTQAASSDHYAIKQNYPNPFSTETIIPMTSAIIGNLQFFNEYGIKMDVTYSQTENGIVIERGNLPSGIYFYRITEAARGTIAEGSVVIGN
jgi:hypothetical protein